MTNTVILVAILIVFSFFVGLIMETYKKMLRDGKSNTFENKVVALLLSLLMGFFVYEAVDLSQITALVRDSIWVALSYGVIIYIGQYETCMNMWKPIIKKWIKRHFENE